jgi:hypothetical protein
LRICRRCGAKFASSVYGGYCTSRCKHARAHKVCEGCGTKFVGREDQRFHDQRCWIRSYNERDTDHSHLGGVAGAKVNKIKWNAYDGPRRAYKKLNGRHLHRQVAEAMLGRTLKENEQVHHKDDDKWNNSWFNIWVFPDRASHAREHATHRRLGVA